MGTSLWAFRLRGVRIEAGGRTLIDELTLDVAPGSRVGVLGPNGAGKSTLLRVIAGRARTDGGDVQVAPGLTVGLFDQEPHVRDADTVLDVVREGAAGTVTTLERYHAVARQLELTPDDGLVTELGRLQEALERTAAWNLESHLQQAMTALGCPDPERRMAQLSGGERRRVALCRLLIQQPDVLLLDEPTNHLDAGAVDWLEGHLASYAGTVVLVTHDRYLLERVTQRIVELEAGRAWWHDGGYRSYLEAKAARLTGTGRKDGERRAELAAELAWIGAGSTGHRAAQRNRLRSYEQMADDAMRHRRTDTVRIPPGPRLGTLVLEVEHLCKHWGNRVVIADLSFSLPPNGIVAVLGPNGVGKTTLFDLLNGRTPPDAGTIRIGPTVRLAYADQERLLLHPDRRAWELLADGRETIRVGADDVSARGFLAAFGLRGPDQDTPVRRLSGGQRHRLALARTLSEAGNLLLLDEPTNDLDLPTLQHLERALAAFPGCALVSAHDRWFLDRIATHTLAWEGTDDDPGRWAWFEGNVEAYLRDRAARRGRSAEQPAAVPRQLVHG
jgi:ATP-binding cassette ChvD family protein